MSAHYKCRNYTANRPYNSDSIHFKTDNTYDESSSRQRFESYSELSDNSEYPDEKGMKYNG
jgi:hypothetical protein